MLDRSLRVRAFLDRWFLGLVVALVVLAALGGWLTYATHVDPGTVSEQRTASSWQTTSQFDHAATVTEDNPVYPAGTTLENRSVYPTGVSPRLNGTYAFTYGASEGGDLNATVSLRLVLRGVQGDGESQRVVWRDVRELRTESLDSISPGETVRVPFAVDVNETERRIAAIEEQFGGAAGRPEVLLRATVDLGGSVNGHSVDRRAEHALPIALGGATYSPEGGGPATERYETTETVAVERGYGPLRSVGAPALLVASLGGLLALGVAGYRGRTALSRAERERLAYEDDRDDFDEWISTIRLPDDALDRPRAEAASLAALVDFAIDTGSSVIENPDDEAYYVLHDGYLYAYQPPSPGAERPDPLTDGDRDAPDEIDEVAPPASIESNGTDGGHDSPADTSGED